MDTERGGNPANTEEPAVNAKPATPLALAAAVFRAGRAVRDRQGRVGTVVVLAWRWGLPTAEVALADGSRWAWDVRDLRAV